MVTVNRDPFVQFVTETDVRGAIIGKRAEIFLVKPNGDYKPPLSLSFIELQHLRDGCNTAIEAWNKEVQNDDS